MATAPKPNLTKSEKWIEKEFGVDLVKFKDMYQPEGSKRRQWWINVLGEFQDKYEPFIEKVRKAEKIKLPDEAHEGIEAQERVLKAYKTIMQYIKKSLDVPGAIDELNNAEYVFDTLNESLDYYHMKKL
jgi:hypothetical protein